MFHLKSTDCEIQHYLIQCNVTWRLSQQSRSEWWCVYICVSISMSMVSFRVSSLNHSKIFTWMLMLVYSMFVSTAEDVVYHCIASPSLSAPMRRNWMTEKSFTLPQSILNKLKVRLGKVSGFWLYVVCAWWSFNLPL